jgi:hypothetical protein
MYSIKMVLPQSGGWRGRDLHHVVNIAGCGPRIAGKALTLVGALLNIGEQMYLSSHISKKRDCCVA